MFAILFLLLRHVCKPFLLLFEVFLRKPQANELVNNSENIFITNCWRVL